MDTDPSGALVRTAWRGAIPAPSGLRWQSAPVPMSISPAGITCFFPPYSMTAIDAPQYAGNHPGTSKPTRPAKPVQAGAKSRQGRKLGPQLQMVEFLVQTRAREQVPVRAGLANHPVVEHQNQVGVLHGREPV